jgi:hypothetical protein
MADNTRRTLGVRLIAEGVEATRKAIESVGVTAQQAGKKLEAAFRNIRISGAISSQLTQMRTQIAQTFSNLRIAQGFTQQFGVIRTGLQQLRQSFAALRINPDVQAALAALRIRLAQVVLEGARFGQSFRTLGTAIGSLGTSISNVVKNLALLKGSILLVAGAVGLLAQRSASNAEAIQNQASALGLSTDQYQRLAAAARDTGIEQSRLDRILAKFTVGVEEAGDETEKTGDKTKKAAKQFEEFTVKAADGTDKIISVTRGAKDLSKSVAGIESVTKKGAEGLKEYAANLLKLKTTQEQLAQVTKDFGTRGAAETLTVLRNLGFQFNDTARAAAGLIKPLSNAEIGALVDLDTAFDNLGTNLLTLKDRIVSVFGPTLGAAIRFATGLIQAYEKQILAFAELIKVKVITILLDLIEIFRGNEGNVSNKWLLDIRDAAIVTKDAFVLAFKTIIFGFNQVRNGASGIASLINSIFGTSISGDALLAAAAFLKFSGVLGVFASVAATAAAALQVVTGALRLAGPFFGVSAIAATGYAVAITRVIGAGALLAESLSALTGQARALSYLLIFGTAGASTVVFVFWEDFKAAALEAFNTVEASGIDWQGAMLAIFAAINPATQIGPLLAAGFSQVWESVKASALEFKAFLTSQIFNPDSLLNTFTANFVAAWKSLFDQVTALGRTFASQLASAIGSVIDTISAKISALISRIRAALAAATSNSEGAGVPDPGPGFASGGYISGPGTSRSDSIPARLSNGEFVLTARAVRKWGLSALYAMNNLRLPSMIRHSFADGGFVGPSFTPSFATKSFSESGGALHRVEFNMGGETIGGFRAQASALQQLGKVAQRTRLASTGRVPHWKGKL